MNKTLVTCIYKPEIKETLEKEHKMIYDIMRLHGFARDLSPMPEEQYEMIKDHAKKEGIAITEYFNVYKKEFKTSSKTVEEEVKVEATEE